MSASIHFTHIDEYHDTKVRRARAKVKETKQTCPVCLREVAPENFDKHNAVYHKDNPVTFVTNEGFDFDGLDIETRITVIQEDKEFDRHMEDAGKSFLRACQNIQRIHTALCYKHPGFTQYIESKPGLSERTAYRMLSVAQMSASVANIQATPTALYMLANKATPKEAKQIALDKAAAGELITPAKVRQIISEHGVKEPETIVRLVDGEKQGREWVNEVAASGWIQPGDEEDARHIADTPQEVDTAIAKREENNRIIGAQASDKPFTPTAQPAPAEPTTPAFMVETECIEGQQYAVIRFGAFPTKQAAIDGGQLIMRLYAEHLAELDKKAKEARKAEKAKAS